MSRRRATLPSHEGCHRRAPLTFSARAREEDSLALAFSHTKRRRGYFRAIFPSVTEVVAQALHANIRHHLFIFRGRGCNDL
jgi:hypothetical protein